MYLITHYCFIGVNISDDGGRYIEITFICVSTQFTSSLTLEQITQSARQNDNTDIRKYMNICVCIYVPSP